MSNSGQGASGQGGHGQGASGQGGSGQGRSGQGGSGQGGSGQGGSGQGGNSQGGLPSRLTDGSRVERIESWTGPWPLEERWWDPQAARRQARLQIVTTKGVAHLLVVEGGDWWLEASYT